MHDFITIITSIAAPRRSSKPLRRRLATNVTISTPAATQLVLIKQKHKAAKHVQLVAMATTVAVQHVAGDMLHLPLARRGEEGAADRHHRPAASTPMLAAECSLLCSYCSALVA
jgi:hypothetical protein